MEPPDPPDHPQGTHSFVKAEFDRQQKYDQDKQDFLNKAIAEYKQILANEPFVKEELNRQQDYDTWKKSSLNSQLVEYKQKLKPSVETELARRLAYNEQQGSNSSTQFGDILRAGIHGIEGSDERYEKAFLQLKEHIERIKASEDYRRYRKDTKFGKHST